MQIRRILLRIRKQALLFREFGHQSLTDDLLNGFRVWSMKDGKVKAELATGSISGMDGSYLNIVELAVAEKRYFSKFKSNREYREILEHVNREQGSEYLNIMGGYGTAQKGLVDFCKQDVSKPFRYTYAKFGRVSPTNLRYAKITLDLEKLFGSTKNFKIAEIGIGYGGQCLAVSQQNAFSSYTFYDLPQVIRLSRKYLKLFDTDQFQISDGDFSVESNYDLVISNYAFSEITRDLQERYMSSVVLKSKRGYVIYNDIGTSGFDTMSIEEFVSRIPGSVMLNEAPLTHPRNKLVVWGHTRTDELAQ
jgi:hypothetical protein